MKITLLKGLAMASLVSIMAMAGMAEETAAKKNRIILNFKGGFSFADSTWRFSHPLTENGQTTAKYMDGSAAKGPFFEAGVEFKNDRVGWRFLVGTMPAKITVNPDDLTLFETRIVTFHSHYFSLNRVYYFAAENSRFCPFVNGGLGMIKCSGGITNFGALVNLGTGLAIKPLGNLFFTVGLEGRIPVYLNFRESASMNRTIRFFSPVLFFGISYRLH